MRSSGSTPSRSGERRPRLYLWIAGDDDPKACTGLRLVRLGRAVRVSAPGKLRPAPVVLNPHASTPLSRADAPAAGRGGILAVDCSWNRLAGRSGLFPGADPFGPHASRGRRLPYLFAANPQHYGRLGELNTVEALSAALFVLGYPDEARLLLGGFRGGEALFTVNAAAFAAYQDATTADGVQNAERRLFGGTPA